MGLKQTVWQGGKKKAATENLIFERLSVPPLAMIASYFIFSRSSRVRILSVMKTRKFHIPLSKATRVFPLLSHLSARRRNKCLFPENKSTCIRATSTKLRKKNKSANVTRVDECRISRFFVLLLMKFQWQTGDGLLRIQCKTTAPKGNYSLLARNFLDNRQTGQLPTQRIKFIRVPRNFPLIDRNSRETSPTKQKIGYILYTNWFGSNSNLANYHTMIRWKIFSTRTRDHRVPPVTPGKQKKKILAIQRHWRFAHVYVKFSPHGPYAHSR